MKADLWTRSKDDRKVMEYGGPLGTFNPEAKDRHVYLVFESLAAAPIPVAPPLFFRDQPGNPPLYIGGDKAPEKIPRSRTPAVEVPKSKRHSFDLVPEPSQGTPAVEVPKRKKRLFEPAPKPSQSESPHRFEVDP
jgi:hypothetical protein